MRFLEYFRKIPRTPILVVFLSTANVILLGVLLSRLQFSGTSLSVEGDLGIFALVLQIFCEIAVPIGIGVFCLSRSWPWRIFAYAVALLQLAVMITQVAAYVLTCELLTSLAIRNIYHIALVLNGSRLAMLVGIAMCAAAFIFVCERAPRSPRRYSFKTVAITGLLLVACGTANFVVPANIAHARDSFLLVNNLDSYSPGVAFCDVLYDVLWDRLHPNEVEAGLNVVLTPADIDKARACGIFLDMKSPYPLVHDKIYQGDLPFALRPHATKKPNIIVFFTEGLSARLVGSYGSHYSDLTPHIDSFVKHPRTMQVKNYYNHTAATYRGIHGQLCSLYPRVDGPVSRGEHQVGYFGLLDILKQLGYSTYFLDAHRKDEGYVDEMVRDLGVENVYTSEDMSPRYLANAEPLRVDALSDSQLYNSLVGFLKEHEKDAASGVRPFFVSLYNLGTHAFCEVSSDGIPYKDGENDILNTVHSLDDAFGKFWKAFQESPLADNTVVVFTSDHCHFPEPCYVAAIAPFDPSYKRFFFDTIPLAIYDPTHNLPKTFDAEYATSVDFTPTLVHMLGFPNQANPFLGTSLFDTQTRQLRGFGVAYHDRHFHFASARGIRLLEQETSDGRRLLQIQKILDYTKALEKKGQIWPAMQDAAVADRIQRQKGEQDSNGDGEPRISSHLSLRK